MDKHLYTAMRKEWEEAPPLKSFTVRIHEGSKELRSAGYLLYKLSSW